MTEQIQTPPWGDDANFDASKAWSLIQNLRAEVDGLKTAKTALVAERDDALAKAQDEADALARVRAESEQAVKDAQEVADQRRAELEQVSTLRTKEALLVDAGLPRDLADLVNGSDEDALKTSVERLAALRGPGAAQDRRPDPAQAASVETDPRAALAEQIFGS